MARGAPSRTALSARRGSCSFRTCPRSSCLGAGLSWTWADRAKLHNRGAGTPQRTAANGRLGAVTVTIWIRPSSDLVTPSSRLRRGHPQRTLREDADQIAVGQVDLKATKRWKGRL